MSRVIRRSAALRDLPPEADRAPDLPSVTSTPMKGARVRVRTFSGVEVDAILTEVRPDATGWIATARMTDPAQVPLLRRAGVPARSIDEHFTVFEWQLL